jgi:hypothetical protein
MNRFKCTISYDLSRPNKAHRSCINIHIYSLRIEIRRCTPKPNLACHVCLHTKRCAMQQHKLDSSMTTRKGHFPLQFTDSWYNYSDFLFFCCIMEIHDDFNSEFTYKIILPKRYSHSTILQQAPVYCDYKDVQPAFIIAC